jgi:hypothetical protein
MKITIAIIILFAGITFPMKKMFFAGEDKRAIEVIPNAGKANYLFQNLDSLDALHAFPLSKSNDCEANIIIIPAEANNAEITVIRKSIIESKLNEAGYSSEAITPDTIAIEYAPASLFLPLGDYDIITNKEGFKTFRGEFALSKPGKIDIPIELISIAYLKEKQEQFRMYKWISLGTAVLAGLSSYYFNGKVHTYNDENNHSLSVGGTVNSRNKIIDNQNYYKISTSISFTAISCFFISWIFEGITFGY